MTEQQSDLDTGVIRQSGQETKEGSTRDNQENELVAEHESAAAMDADVPQPPGASETTEGQPS